MNGQLYCKSSKSPTVESLGIASRVPPLDESQTPKREQAENSEVLVHDEIKIPRVLREWLIAKYLEDPQPDLWPINNSRDVGPATLIRFTDCTDFLLRCGIEMSILDRLANAGFISDIRAIIDIKKDASKQPQPRAFLRLQLPVGDHRLLAIHKSVLNSDEDLNRDAKKTITTKTSRRPGRPKDKARPLVIKVIERERQINTPWKQIPGIVNKELGKEYETTTLQQMYRTRMKCD